MKQVRVLHAKAEEFEEVLYANGIDFHIDVKDDTPSYGAYVILDDDKIAEVERIIDKLGFKTTKKKPEA